MKKKEEESKIYIYNYAILDGSYCNKMDYNNFKPIKFTMWNIKKEFFYSHFVKVQVLHNVVDYLINMYSEQGNDIYVSKLTEHKFNHRIMMVYQDEPMSKKNFRINQPVSDMFSHGIATRHNNVLFLDEDQFGNDNTVTQEEYDSFFEDVCALCYICAEASYITKQNRNPIQLEETKDAFNQQGKSEWKYPEHIRLHFGANNVVDMTNYDEIKYYLENVYFDDQPADMIKLENGNVIRRKQNVLYICDGSTGEVDAYFGPSFTSKFKN